MSIIANIRAAARALIGGKTEARLGLTPIIGSFGYRGPGDVSTSVLMRQASGWVYACVRRIATSIGSMEIELYRKTGKERTDWEQLDEHPLLDLLNRPNAQMQRAEFFEILSMHEDLTGNAYIYLEGVQDENSIPIAMYPLRPDFVTPIAGALPEIITGYQYDNGQIKKTFATHEIIQLRIPSPANPYQGLGPTAAAIDAIEADAASRQWNRSIFQGANPGLMFKTTGITPEAIKTLRESFEDRHVGAGKQHRVALLPEGVEVATGTSQPKDMEFSETRTMSRDELFAMYGVPGVVLGLGLGESMNRASAETLEYVFNKHTIKPKTARFIRTFNAFLVPRFGDDLVIDYVDPVPENIETRLNEARSALSNQPYKSINEVRGQFGLAPIENGDAVMGSSLQVEVGKPEKKAIDTPSISMKKKCLTANHVKTESAKKQAAKEYGLNAMADSVAKSLNEMRKKEIEDAIAGDWAPKWEAMVKRMSTEEKDFGETMKKYAVGMGERATTSLKEGQKAVDIDDLLDDEDEVSTIIKLTSPIYQSILAKEGKAAAELIGEAFDENDERVQKSLAKGIQLMAKEYQKETVALLQDKLQAGLDAGEGLDDLTARVQEVADFSEKTRAERVAKTETFRTANFATREAWQQSGVVSEVKWYTAEDEMVCEFCGPMQDTVVGIDQGFFDKNDEIIGADGGVINTDYASVENPPLHPNCRCYLRPETINI